MGKTKINYGEEAWSIVTGCTPVSSGCKNCWARELHNRRHRAYLDGKKMPPQYTKPFEVVQLHENRLDEPLHWRNPRRVLVAFGGDLFHEDVPIDTIANIFAVMRLAEQHTFLVLTKRAERMHSILTGSEFGMEYRDTIEVLTGGGLTGFGPPLDNVWLGVSVEDQITADERIPLLLKTPAAVRFVSCEPLLGPVDLKPAEIGQWPDMTRWMPNKEEWDDWKYWMHKENGIQWVIVGGESGPGARPMHPDWAHSMRDQCQAAGTPFFFKQWGEWLQEDQIYRPINDPNINVLNYEAHRVLMRGSEKFEDLVHQWEDTTIAFRVGKKAAGHLLDGVEWQEFPEVLNGK